MDTQRTTIGKQGIVERLNDFLKEGGLTTENFKQLEPVVNALFPAATVLGMDIASLYREYQLEIVQYSGNPSRGRLRYIKGHLQKLLKKVKEYNP